MSSEIFTLLTTKTTQSAEKRACMCNLIKTVAEHAVGNLRAMMMIGDKLLKNTAEILARLLGENFFFEKIEYETKKKRQGK